MVATYPHHKPDGSVTTTELTPEQCDAMEAWRVGANRARAVAGLPALSEHLAVLGFWESQ